MCSSLQIDSSRIFGGWPIHAGHLDSFQWLVKKKDAHKHARYFGCCWRRTSHEMAVCQDTLQKIVALPSPWGSGEQSRRWDRIAVSFRLALAFAERLVFMPS
jgi:hypothetical protein